jgi:hypothetical protein
MATKKEKSPERTTKKEMLDTYAETKAKIDEKAKSELKPEKVKEEKKDREVVLEADVIASSDLDMKIDILKSDITKSLSDVSEKVRNEAEKYKKLQAAVEVREKELSEIYEVEKAASSLAALIESQIRIREEFDNEMEISRNEFEKEKEIRECTLREEKAEEEKTRKRLKDEFDYSFKRECEFRKNKFNDEMVKIEKEFQIKKEDFERNIAEREKSLAARESAMAEKEKILKDLQERVNGIENEITNAVAKNVKESTEKLKLEFSSKEALIVKGFEGERNVLLTKIESLDSVLISQKQQVEILQKKIEDAYAKVQDIAVKAVDGAARQTKSITIQSSPQEK